VHEETTYGAWLRRLLAGARLEVLPGPELQHLVEAVAPEASLTVACLPRSDMQQLLATVSELRGLGYQVTPHLAARSIKGSEELEEVAERLRTLDVTDVFVIGGDRSVALGCYPSAQSLLEDLCSRGLAFTETGVACYPEHHPLIDDAQLLDLLRAKQAYASYMVSQICFDGELIAKWLARMRASGITLPLYVGLPGVVELGYLLRVSIKVGVGDSLRFLRKNRGLLRLAHGSRAFNPDRLLHELQCALEAEGQEIAGFHLNTFNNVAATERWRQERLLGAGPIPGRAATTRAR
jgi:methylenetetrahydrofolate reductase (NADPH)